MKTIVFFLLLFTTQVTLSQTNAGKPENINNIKQVIEDFRVAIIHHKDEKQFANLFLENDITWATIYTGKTKEALLKRKPDFKFQSSNFTDFFKLLNSKNEPVEEKFYNVQISTRNNFATVSFDYSFNLNQKVANWGVEYWSLIEVNGSWKITSVTWTTNLQHFEKCPFKAENQVIYHKSENKQ